MHNELPNPKEFRYIYEGLNICSGTHPQYAAASLPWATEPVQSKMPFKILQRTVFSERLYHKSPTRGRRPVHQHQYHLSRKPWLSISLPFIEVPVYLQHPERRSWSPKQSTSDDCPYLYITFKSSPSRIPASSSVNTRWSSTSFWLY